MERVCRVGTRPWSRIAWTAVGLALAGCAATGPGAGPESAAKSAVEATGHAQAGPAGASASPPVQTVQVPAAQQFSGRLSLRVHQPRTGATDGGTLLFEFDGSPEAGTLVLQTVIGTAVATARWNAQGAEIVTAKGRQTGPRLDDLAGALLGQALPLAAILQWVRAEPWPLAPHRVRAAGFDQLGWSISLEAWHEGVVTAHRSAQPDRPGELDITVRARLDLPAAAGEAGRP